MSGKRLIVLSMVIACGLLSPANAQQDWQLTKLQANSYPLEIVAETRKSAPDGLPDGLVATGTGDIVRAWYGSPTRRYRHAILGDGVEAGSLHIRLPSGRSLNLILPRSEVFEDRYPRLADLDGNGTTEIITIRSSLSKGASVTIYGVKNNRIVQKASTGFIGRANRWLNIAGIAPFLGIKGNEIAFVKTPHIGGSLFIMRYSKGQLIQIGAEQGFSNHVIGSREMRLSALADIDGNGQVEIALPSADRQSLKIVGPDASPAGAVIDGRGNMIVVEKGQLGQSGLKQYGSVKLPAAIDKAIGIQTKGTRGFVVGLENGDIYLVHR